MIRRVLESIKAGKRLPEARFANLSIAAKGQKSVYGMFPKPFRNNPEAVVGTTGSNVLGETTAGSNGGSARETMICYENAMIG